MPDCCIDLTITSPPYDNLRTYNGYTFDFEGIAKELYRVTKQGGVVVWVVGDATIKGSETGTSFKQALYFKNIGFNLHDTMIWNKLNPVPLTHNRYEQGFEYMFIFSKGKPKTVNHIRELSTCIQTRTRRKSNKENGSAFRSREEYTTTNPTKIKTNVWGYTNANVKVNHPAIFPEKLAEDHILSWSNEGDTILDPMAGSGTALKMAKQNNRNYIGIEISPEYINIINQRLTNICP
jgi:site-specific DNA-methyltransferase (adenine-specific)